MSEFLVKKKESERHFLDQLLDGSKLDKFSIPVPIKCELRKYQQVYNFVDDFLFCQEIKIRESVADWLKHRA